MNPVLQTEFAFTARVTVSAPVAVGDGPEGLRRFVFLEYLKTAIYWVRFGITPWTKDTAI